MKYNVCVITGSRAEFGLLLPLIERLDAQSTINLHLVVTGSHLEASFGDTQWEIEESGIPIHKKIEIPLDGDKKEDMAKATGIAMIAFAEYFGNFRPDLLVVLGDRYEIFAAASAAALLAIPIAHLHGGEATEGLVDEFLRHSITKMSYLHFTSCEQYRQRVIQLGEAPDRVYNVGALGVENLFRILPMTIDELETSLGFSLKGSSFSVVTFHPVTLEDDTSAAQLQELILAMDDFPEMKHIITLANADAGGRTINEIWKNESQKRDNWLVVGSLGVRRYLSALQYAEIMLGNSSSGILESPAVRIPVVNIGDRQKGRVMAENIIQCEPNHQDITAAIKQALSLEHKEKVLHTVCPFGNGDTSKRIFDVIYEFLETGSNYNKKSFYNILT